MAGTISFYRENAPTIVLFDRRHNRPAWYVRPSGELVLLCFANLELAELFRRRVLSKHISKKFAKRFPAMQMLFDDWIVKLREIRNEDVEGLSVVFGFEGDTIQKGYVRIDDVLASFCPSWELN